MLTRRIFLAAVCALAALPAFAQDKLDLTILHTNDLHGHTLPFSYTEPGRSKNEQTSVGGAARRATLIRELKKKAKNPVLVIDLGDVATRGPLTNAYEGIADIEALNATGYDIGTIGNNEFKLKDAAERFDAAGAQNALLQVLRRSHFPWVCANAGIGDPAKGELIPGVHPYLVREINGVRIGFLGLTAPRSNGYPQVKGWWVSDPVEAAKKWIPIVRKNCDVLIALTHVGVDDDTKLAQQTTGIDAIVGGDSHTFLYKPLVVNGVPIVQTGEFGVNLGKFDLHFAKTPGLNGGWKLAGYEYALLPITSKLKEAKDVKAVADAYAAPLKNGIAATLPERFLGTTPVERTHRTTETIAAALAKATHSEIGLHVEGDGLFEVFRTQTLTRYDIWAVMPFKNKVATLTMTGAELAELKQKTKGLVLSAPARDPNKTYTVALVDFTATGTLKLDASRLSIGGDLREAVITGLQQLR
ncbi:bifunctional metallophosphatase/5'-nucleotidase [Armatimonas sp.]|uniref:bifunctional metallophosphatase/5'-nucleotidase n=1 Tax=Armatimonas sp. TaxID=1872638 RepID=UPI0037523044